ncbi:MAG: transcriptional regulator, partial [Cytophagales bacterium]|nr:transcriptional regulator [Cytophaga sp.]
MQEIITSDTRKTIWIIIIPKHLPRRPVLAHDKYWQRVEDSLIELRKERLDVILKEPVAINEDWSAQIITDATHEDLDSNAIQKAKEEYKKKNPGKAEDCDKWDLITFLNKAKITIKGKITNAAILLLGKEESVHFISPAVAKISWIIKNANNKELDYEHFGPPFILQSMEVFNKIRNLTYRYLEDSSLFPIEVKMYEPYVIREALHNCIAHQDYTLQGRISVIEKPDELIFTNLGSFLPGDVQSVIEQDAPQEYYRNVFLAEAMVNLNMMDTIGSGIKRMFEEQRNRFFPLPDYDLSDINKVVVRVSGRIWDENYTRLLMSKTDLDLKTVILLDRVQKSLHINDDELNLLRRDGLVEGRKPTIYVAAYVAQATNASTDYIKNKAFNDDYYRKLIVAYLEKYRKGIRIDFDTLLFDKLSDVLNESQKKDKVKNLLQALKNDDIIKISE